MTTDGRQFRQPFSLYVHIPYCVTKCPYCDFNSHAASRWPEEEYTAALIAELEHYAAQEPWRSGALATIFFGGGTPSLFAPESIAQVLHVVRGLWPGPKQGKDPLPITPYPSPIEITLEANPGTVTLDKLRGFRAAGVNRLSFGVQSFDPKHLVRLGRIHSSAEAIAAIALAREAGFDNVNLDLMFAVPEQTLAEWEIDLHTAIGLGTDHLSVYNLTYEEGTAFHAMRKRGELAPLPEEIEIAMFTRTQELLSAAGFAQYEISNYALPGRACHHNLNYWRAGGYLGIGAGAHSFASAVAPGQRWSNEKSPALYVARIGAAGHARVSLEELTPRQARGEFMFLGLRCLEGIDASTFRARFGVELLDAFPHNEALRRNGLLASSGERWQLTARGLHVADSVFATYL